jgi:hypothetical protein
MTTLSRAAIIDRLRAHTASEKAAWRPPMPPEPLPADAPEPTGTEACARCSRGLWCGEPCRWCGEPIAPLNDRWFHCHGQREHFARPIPREVKL